ncbi:Putative multidrug export ATP-binding/permease protein [Paenibacillus auburnensis]|uniref:Multidrug export ATP-binding/permease protein n=1 Tax=Paenibacillus auburnensis TaxID=2905649 RepID=A0ABN8FRN9_9BACL|nr:ABC transporter ATP-binding protein [Paenibacillus auburnensis]CAH1190992.1 Putative multidrug export ATP-binding/permease protein [Paenibacillus auburnensis]
MSRGFGPGGGFGGGPGHGKLKFDDDERRPNISKALLLRISKYFAPYWKQTLVVMLVLIVSAVLGLLPPILIQQIIDVALPDKNLTLLVLLVLASLGTTVISGLLGVLQNYLNSFISQNIVHDMKNQMYRHLQRMPLQFFSGVKQGEVITRMTSDISGVQGVFNSTIVNFASNLFILGSTAAALFIMNWKLALLGILVVPLFIIPTRKMGNVRWKLAKQTQEKVSEQNQVIQETLSISGYLLMKLFTKENAEYKSFAAINAEATSLQIRESMAGRWFMMVLSTFTSIGPMLIYLYGGFLFIQGELSVGTIITFVALLGRLYGPVMQMTNLYVDIKRSVALFERIFDYFDMEPLIVDEPQAQPFSAAGKSIAFENVGFAYQPDKPALHGIQFTAAAGTLTALVGPSGAGKTTITNLIPRLYEVTSGKITIGGRNIRDFTLESLRSQIGLVTQDTYLFNGTIRENLLYACPEAGETEIIEACRSAYIHDFIMGLPEGYDTVVGNRGIKLSGGEKQRISIARVLLKNPPVIIMDEATSSLDTVSEFYIQQAMHVLLRNKTSIVIAHRLSTIMAADQILVVKDGAIAEEGTHEALLEQNGVYKDLYNKQFEPKVFA